MRASQHLLLQLGLALSLLSAGASQAYVPTAQEDCANRNSAICEINNLPTMQAGPCPSGAKTIRPAGNEDCTKIAAVRPESRLPETAQPPAQEKYWPKNDMARYAKTERWLLPLLTIGGLALALGLLIVVIRRQIRQFRNGKPLKEVMSIPALLASSAIGFFVASYSAGFVFNQVSRSFNNTDTAGPVLIGGFAALLAFVAAFQLASSLVALVLLRWLKQK